MQKGFGFVDFPIIGEGYSIIINPEDYNSTLFPTLYLIGYKLSKKLNLYLKGYNNTYNHYIYTQKGIIYAVK